MYDVDLDQHQFYEDHKTSLKISITAFAGENYFSWLQWLFFKFLHFFTWQPLVDALRPPEGKHGLEVVSHLDLAMLKQLYHLLKCRDAMEITLGHGQSWPWNKWYTLSVVMLTELVHFPQRLHKQDLSVATWLVVVRKQRRQTRTREALPLTPQGRSWHYHGCHSRAASAKVSIYFWRW